MRVVFSGCKMFLFFSLILGTACGANADMAREESSKKQQLTIYAAASLIEAFNELGETFENSHPNIDVVISFAGSQQIAQQLSQGAPGDLFASANEIQMKNVINSDRVKSSAVKVFIHNQLELIVPGDNPGKITDFEDITKSGLKVILADESVPVGAYTQQMLDRANQQADLDRDFKSKVISNVVSYEENVRSVLTKIILGEADAGIVYMSDAFGIPETDLRMLAIPGDINVSASYFIAPLVDSPQEGLAKEFISLVLSPAGQEILSNHGFVRIDDRK